MVPVNSKKFLAYLALICVLLVFCAPEEADCRHVIFKAPLKDQVVTGQILSSRPKEKSCAKCHMRDHRGNCRRMISYGADGC